MLYAGALPPRSVVLTFDDGGHDFYAAALPVLQEYGFPATVYLRTDYCGQPTPIFMLMLSYLLWRAGSRHLGLHPHGGGVVDIDTRTAVDASQTAARLATLARSKGMGIEAKNELLSQLADALDIDYDAILASRILQIMSPAEVATIANGGIDVQLHTHNHHSPRNEREYRFQIATNRSRISELTGKTPNHFCYPSGEHAPEFLPWLSLENVSSAVTGVPGLASRKDQRFLLPRFVDTMQRSTIDFRAWLSGAGTLAARPPRYNL
jgi:peptidoglycan/xylan/chitin deacetylase (PgdA/CDA1 family)